MKLCLKLMRVHHYVKNLLIFAPLICSGSLFHQEKLLSCILAFLAFSAVSSVVYIINDIKDKEKDRHHPTKCRRPIASGDISVNQAWILAAALLAIAMLCNSLEFQYTSTFLLVLYLVLNLAYSSGLKNIPILDVTILVAGFLIRILYGALVTQILISNWLYLTVVALSFYFALGKRRNEMRQLGNDKTREVLKAYPISFLDKNMSMFLTLANVFYALWSMDEKTTAFYGNNYLIFTVPLVLLITMKYSLDVEGDSDGDPVEVLLHDKTLLILCLIYAAVIFTILYIPKLH